MKFFLSVSKAEHLKMCDTVRMGPELQKSQGGGGVLVNKCSWVRRVCPIRNLVKIISCRRVIWFEEGH